MVEPRDTTFQHAARELRDHLHRSQQSMATFLGLSMAALRNYESGAVTAPDARAATAYLLAAEMSDRLDLVEVFGSALHQAMGIEEPSFRKRIEELPEGGGDLENLRILAQMGQLRTHPLAKTLFIEPVNDFEKRMITALLACIRGQGPFKKYQKSIYQALASPWALIDEYAEPLRLLKREGLQDQLMTFKKAIASKSQTRKERTSK
jgi:transcriptional regulator with XRE-family HTH domain